MFEIELFICIKWIWYKITYKDWYTIKPKQANISNMGLELKKIKCVSIVVEVLYCGHKVTVEGVRSIKPNPRAMQESPRPQNTSQLKSCYVCNRNEMGRMNLAGVRYGIWWTRLLVTGGCSWCSGSSDGLQNRSKRVRTLVSQLISISDKYPWYEPPYPPRYGLNSTTIVFLEG